MKGKKGAPSPQSLTPHPCPLPTTYPLTLLQPDTPTLRRTWYKSRSVRGAGGGRPVSTMDLFTSRPLGQVSAGTLMSRARVYGGRLQLTQKLNTPQQLLGSLSNEIDCGGAGCTTGCSCCWPAGQGGVVYPHWPPLQLQDYDVPATDVPLHRCRQQ